MSNPYCSVEDSIGGISCNDKSVNELKKIYKNQEIKGMLQEQLNEIIGRNYKSGGSSSSVKLSQKKSSSKWKLKDDKKKVKNKTNNKVEEIKNITKDKTNVNTKDETNVNTKDENKELLELLRMIVKKNPDLLNQI